MRDATLTLALPLTLALALALALTLTLALTLSQVRGALKRGPGEAGAHAGARHVA